MPPTPSEKARTIIMGGAGRDFHSFNVFFRKCGVVVFTALQILGIERHKYLPHWQGFYNPRGYLSAPKQNSRT